MENKKLLNILTKDMQELEELIAEIKLEEKFNPFELEFIHTRAKGLVSLVNLLQNNENEFSLQQVGDTLISKNEPDVQVDENVIEESIPESIDPELNTENLDKGEFEEDLVEEPKAGIQVSKIVQEQEENEEKETVEPEDQDEIEEDGPKEATTIGDSYSSEKSINDLIYESKKNIQNTISSRPISSLQSAVGINDRFLFIRELFEGDGDKYAVAVKKLDQMTSINDAVSYLRDNYKWKKNETSLKFIELVKRRFAHD